MASKKKTDWELIERDYRADMKSIAQIARENGVASSTIRSRAKAGGWIRDLKTRIKLKTDEYVNKAAMQTVAAVQATEEQTVEENARLTAGVRLQHRKDIALARNMAMTMFDDLSAMIGADGRTGLAELLKTLVDTGELADGGEVEAFKRATGLSAHVNNMQRLTDTLSKVVALERQAWGLDNFDDKPHDPLAALLTELTKNHSNGLAVVYDDPEYDDDDDDAQPLASPDALNTLKVADDDDY